MAVEEGNAIGLLIFPESVVICSKNGRFIPDVRRLFIPRRLAGFFMAEIGQVR